MSLSRRDFLRLSAGAAVSAGLGLSPSYAYAEPVSVGVIAGVGMALTALLAGLGVWNRTVIDNQELGQRYIDIISRDSAQVASAAAEKAAEANYATNQAELQAIADTGELANELAAWANAAAAEGGRMALAGYDALSGLGLMARESVAHFIQSMINAPAATLCGVEMPFASSYAASITGFSPICMTYAEHFPSSFVEAATAIPEGCTAVIYFVDTYEQSGTVWRMQAFACSELTYCHTRVSGSNIEWVLHGNNACHFYAYSTGVRLWGEAQDDYSFTVYHKGVSLQGSGVCGHAIGIDDLPGLEPTPEALALDPPMPWDAPLVGGDMVIDGMGISDPGTVAIPGVLGTDGVALPGIGVSVPWTDALWGLQAGVIDRPIAGGLPIPLEGTYGWVGTLEGVKALPIETAISTPTSIALDVPISVAPVPPINPIPGVGGTPTLPPWGDVGNFPLLSFFPFNMTVTLFNFLGRLANG